MAEPFMFPADAKLLYERLNQRDHQWVPSQAMDRGINPAGHEPMRRPLARTGLLHAWGWTHAAQVFGTNRNQMKGQWARSIGRRQRVAPIGRPAIWPATRNNGWSYGDWLDRNVKPAVSAPPVAIIAVWYGAATGCCRNGTVSESRHA